MPIVGYFLWKRTPKGRLAPSKLLKDHRDFALSSSNKQVIEAYHQNLVAEIPLDEEMWKVSLDDLIQRFPSDGYVKKE